MQITSNMIDIQFKGLVPIKKYKGPLLKLTAQEKDRIACLQEHINQMEFELYHLSKRYEGKHLRTEIFDNFMEKKFKLMVRIKQLKDVIRNIKINRLNIQKSVGKVN